MAKLTTESDNIRIVTIKEAIEELNLKTTEDILSLPAFDNSIKFHRSLLLSIYDGITHKGDWPESPDGWNVINHKGSEDFMKRLNQVSISVLVLILYYIYCMKKDFSQIATPQKISFDHSITIWEKLKVMITNNQIRDLPQLMHYFCAIYEEFGNTDNWRGDFDGSQISQVTDLLILKKLSFS